MRSTKKITLTDKQLDYLVRHFKDTDNEYLAAALDISESTLHRFARQYGLTKTKAHVRQMQREAAAAAKVSHLKHGTYPPKGYIIPGSEEHRFKPGHKEKASVKRRRLEKAHEARRQTVIQERMRIMRGEPQETKIRLRRQPQQKIGDRYLLKKRGYIIDDATDTAYWTDATRRALRTEKRERYFKFKQYDGHLC